MKLSRLPFRFFWYGVHLIGSLILAMLVFYICVKAMNAGAQITQTWEEIVPGEKVYCRINGNINFFQRWVCYGEEVRITEKRRYAKSYEKSIRDHVSFMRTDHSSFWYEHEVTWDDFNEKFYEKDNPAGNTVKCMDPDDGPYQPDF